MNTNTLEKLPELVYENRLKQLGENIVKYQNFRVSVILNKIDYAGYSKSTLKSYVGSGISYLRTGKKYKQYGNYYKYIDDAVSRHIQPLTPKQGEQRIEKKQTKKLENNNVKKVIETIYANAKENEKQYAVLIGKDYIRLVDSKESASMIADTLNFVSKINCKIITVKIEEE